MGTWGSFGHILDEYYKNMLWFQQFSWFYQVFTRHILVLTPHVETQSPFVHFFWSKAFGDYSGKSHRDMRWHNGVWYLYKGISYLHCSSLYLSKSAHVITNCLNYKQWFQGTSTTLYNLFHKTLYNLFFLSSTIYRILDLFFRVKLYFL